MFKSFVISLVVALLVLGGTGLILLKTVSSSITDVNQRYAKAINVLKEETESSMAAMSNSIKGNGDLFRMHEKKVNLVRDDVNDGFSTLSNRVSGIEDNQRKNLADVIKQVEVLSTKMNSVSAKLSGLTEIMAQLQMSFRDLSEVKSVAAAAESRPAHSLVVSTVESTQRSIVSNEESSPNACPLAALNTDSRRFILREAIRDADRKGSHVFNAIFDISGDGSSVSSQVESDTAPAQLKSAVNQYIESLRWGDSESGFSSCEMQIRLNIN
ncbi:MAG: hypothetical protein AAEI08_00015 [Gammaproteobacteria bacterium]